ncbi:GLUG motif-containing protein, partial [Vreelandella olivaria]|uniref:GLUG motif-containing protein n=1 Tax=Vreelandella olivaria TaxID=390919 RepID=UPI00201F3FC3
YSEYSTTITNAHQLQLMALDLNADYRVTRDIDASATAGSDLSGMWSTAGFSPIGNTSTFFTGTFAGLGHTIDGLTIARPGQSDIGLFGATGNGAAIRDIGLREINITGHNYVGGLVGRAANSNIAASYATGQVTGNNYVGGLVGYAFFNNNIAASYATGQVTGNGAVGGLVGYAIDSNIAASYATGQVTGNNNVGGLVGVAGGSNIAASYFATTDADGNPINTNLNTLGTGRTWNELTSLETFAGWDIDGQGGTDTVWRIYEGHTTPLLRGFLTPVTVTANDATATY